MAEDNGQDRTEAPTQRRREEARRQGQVAFSTDFNTGVLLLVGLLVLSQGTRQYGYDLLTVVREHLQGAACTFDITPEGAQAAFVNLFNRAVDLLGRFFALLVVAAVAAGVVQVGFVVTTERLTVNFDRLSPANGVGRLFSFAAAIRALTSLLKVLAAVILAYLVIRGRAGQIVALSDGTLASTTAQAWTILMRLALAIAGALVVIGVVDYVLQRVRFERSLRMTRQELKEEVKREEGDPQIKARIRRLQREMAQKRMLQNVPKATVVITNPTHLAVALLYERGRMTSPRVVAKGAGYVAERIIALARRHAVPVLERPAVAQALYKSVEVDQEIPPGLYLVIAEVLAYVYRLRGLAA